MHLRRAGADIEIPEAKPHLELSCSGLKIGFLKVTTKEEVLAALKRVEDPELGRSLVDLGMIREVKVEGAVVYVELALTTGACPLKEHLENEVRRAVSSLPGVEKVLVKRSVMTEEERRRMLAPSPPRSRLLSPDSPTAVVAVASGKGGVGKSTVTANLGLALAREGRSVALLDADIYGFSLHRILGAEGQPEVREGALQPLEVRGVKVMSMGFLVPEDTPLIWRGPMLAGALTQFLQDVDWGEPDFLLIDLPPGTGDVPLTLAQRLPAARVLLVTTPEPLAVSVASRAGHFARKLGQELLGVVENMSYLRCPDCGRVLHPLGQGGGDRLAQALGVPVLARVPMLASPREEPVVEAEPESEPALVFRQLAREVAALAPPRLREPAPRR